MTEVSTDYVTSPLRATGAVTSVVAIVTALDARNILDAAGDAYAENSSAHFIIIEYLVLFALMEFVFLGLFILGFFVSVWALVHIRGNRSPRDAFVTGCLVAATGMIVLVFANAIWRLRGVADLIWLVLDVGLISGGAGLLSLLAWRIAYRRVPNSSP